MARIKYTALVESIRGTIGGTTFQRNAFGFTVKSKPNMVNPNSAMQSARKRGFHKALQTWRGLSDANRANWETYATTNPVASRNNPAAYINGFNAFVRWHAASFQYSANVLNNPSGAQGIVSFVEMELQKSGGVLQMVIDSTVTNGPWYLLVYLTRPLTPTQRFQKSWTKLLRQINYANPIDVDISSYYTSVFGFLPVVGDLIGVDLTYVNTTNGQVIYIPTFIQQVTT